MDVREKLLWLLKNAKAAMKAENLSCDLAKNMFVVDFLIANGVTVQECGVWIGEGDGFADGEIVYDVWYCENCNHCIETDDYDLLPNFCPNCGMKKLPLPQPPKGE